MLQSLSTSGQRYSGKVVQGRGGAEGNLIHYKCGTQPESHCCCRRSRVSRNYVRSVLCSTIPQCCNLACPQTFLVTCVTIPNLVIHEHTKGEKARTLHKGILENWATGTSWCHRNASTDGAAIVVIMFVNK